MERQAFDKTILTRHCHGWEGGTPEFEVDRCRASAETISGLRSAVIRSHCL